MRRRTRVHILAIAISVLYGLEWQFAGSLGFYEDDFLKAWSALETPSDGGWRGALAGLLTDEPLFHLYHAARFRLLGLDHPSWHHVLPGLLQVANTFLVYLLVWRWGRSLRVALSAALLFAAFPGLGQAQYWTSAIYVPLLTLLLLALCFWIAWLRRGGAGNRAAAIGFHAAAIFTHEVAFGAIAVFAALWVWERRRRRSPPRWIELAPFVATNLAYLAMRQTNWLGFGGFNLAGTRELSLVNAAKLAFASFNLNFGPWFWTRTEELAGLAAAPGDAWRAVGLALVLTLAGAWLCGFSDRLSKATILGFVAVAGLGLGLAWWLGPSFFLRGLYVLLAAVLAYAAVSGRRTAAALLAGFGLLWFGATFAPAWAYYIAFRHAYIPAVGAGLVLAAACHALGRPRALRGAQWGAVACLCAVFHLAGLGEARAWMRYHEDIEAVRLALQSGAPPVAGREEVVLLGLPAVRQGHPIFTQLAVGPAVKLWLDDSSVTAWRRFEALPDGYRTDPDKPMRSYASLRLFQFSNGAVKEAGALRFEDGRRIELPHGDPNVSVDVEARRD